MNAVCSTCQKTFETTGNDTPEPGAQCPACTLAAQQVPTPQPADQNPLGVAVEAIGEFTGLALNTVDLVGSVAELGGGLLHAAGGLSELGSGLIDATSGLAEAGGGLGGELADAASALADLLGALGDQ